jgi:hypothetical protein
MARATGFRRISPKSNSSASSKTPDSQQETTWLSVARLPTVESRLARVLVLAMIVGCLFNSFLLDHTEGLLYAWLTGVLYGGLRPQDAS